MADYDFLSVSNGSGEPALMHVNGSGRVAGATSIPVDTITNVATKFIGTYGTIAANGFMDPTTMRNFKGHTSGSSLIIDAFEPGAGTDLGNTAGQVVVIKPTTGWANRVASFIKNATGFGTPENVTFATATVAGLVNSGDASVGGNQTVIGNSTINGNLYVVGTSRTAASTLPSIATLTPSVQIASVTALAVGLTINTPSFAANDGMSLLIRIKDNGTARSITFAAGYTNVSGLDTPTATIANKLLTIGAMYNAATSKWEIQGINQSA